MPHLLTKKRLSRIIEFIEANLGNGFDLNDLSNAAALSRFHLCRSFKCTTGMTLSQYVMSRKIEAAKTMLADEEACLVMIAGTCGFASQSHMCTAFKKATGMTPSAYRAQLKTDPVSVLSA